MNAPDTAATRRKLERWMDTNQLVTDGRQTGRVIGYCYRSEEFGAAAAQVEFPTTGSSVWIDVARLYPLPV